MISAFNLRIHKSSNDTAIDKKKPVILSLLTVHMTSEDCLYYEHDEYK